MSEVGSQKLKVGSRKSEVESQKLEVGSWKSEVGRPFSAFVRLSPEIITSWFAIALDEIRTGRILRENCKQSTCN